MDSVYNYMLGKRNAAAKAGNQDAVDAWDEYLASYEKYADTVRDNLKRYNEIQIENEELANSIQELKDAITDLRIEMYKTAVDAVDNITEINEKTADLQGFLTGLPTDSPFRAITRDLAELNETFGDASDGSVLEADSVFSKTSANLTNYWNWLNGWDSRHNPYGDNEAQLREDALDAYNQGID